jgi:carbamoyl-phosphate synthase large subunit
LIQSAKDELFELKQAGFSDTQIAWLMSKSGIGVTENDVREKRKELVSSRFLNL